MRGDFLVGDNLDQLFFTPCRIARRQHFKLYRVATIENGTTQQINSFGFFLLDSQVIQGSH